MKDHYLTAIVNYARSSIDMNNFFRKSEELAWEDMYGYNASDWWGAGIRYSIDTKWVQSVLKSVHPTFLRL